MVSNRLSVEVPNAERLCVDTLLAPADAPASSWMNAPKFEPSGQLCVSPSTCGELEELLSLVQPEPVAAARPPHTERTRVPLLSHQAAERCRGSAPGPSFQELKPLHAETLRPLLHSQRVGQRMLETSVGCSLSSLRIHPSSTVRTVTAATHPSSQHVAVETREWCNTCWTTVQTST